jgi:hypothetical protein
MKIVRIGLVTLIATLAPLEAHANGRFPDAQQLVVNPENPNDIAVQTTYGFIHSLDGGTSWQWTCEEAAFYGGILDPPIALMGNGVLLAGVFDGLVISTPDKCDYALVPGELADKYVVDVSALKSATDSAIVIHSNGLGGSMFETRVFSTSDGGLSWSKQGQSLPTNFLGLTLDAAPSDASVLYVSGFEVVSSSEYVGKLALSLDGGETWTIKPIPNSLNDSGPYLAAIDPASPGTAYLRLASLAGRLLVTKDYGDSWQEVFTGKGKLLGFALSPDGSELRVGGDEDGIWGANTSDFAFAQVNEVGVRCLTWTNDALFVCGREAAAEFTIGKSQDGGTTIEAIHHLPCLEGPDPNCADDSSIQSACPAPWAAQKQILQTDTCAPVGSSTNSSSSGSTTGGDDGGSGGCQCRYDQPNKKAGALSLLFVAVALRRRRRRQARRASVCSN